MTKIIALLLVGAATSASAQVYRWVDEKGRVNYSNATPPAGAKATIVDAQAKPGPPAPDTQDCYTLRCQGERLEQRLARREQLESRAYAERIAATPRPPRGLEFRKYMWLERGMSEGEFLTIAGAPDILTHEFVDWVQDSYLLRRAFREGEDVLVFNRFWRADPARAKTRGGTGLGLSIAVEDTELHEGKLRELASHEI